MFSICSDPARQGPPNSYFYRFTYPYRHNNRCYISICGLSAMHLWKRVLRSKRCRNFAGMKLIRLLRLNIYLPHLVFYLDNAAETFTVRYKQEENDMNAVWHSSAQVGKSSIRGEETTAGLLSWERKNIFRYLTMHDAQSCRGLFCFSCILYTDV